MIKKIFGEAKNLAFSQTAKQTYITTFGAGINAFLGFIFTIIVARALSPSDFGVFAVISSLVLIFLGFSDLGTTAGAMRFIPTVEEKDQKRIIKVIYLVTTAAAMALSLFLFFASDFFSEIIFKTNNFSFLVKLSSPAILGLSLWTVSCGILYAQKKFVRGVLVDTSAVIFKLSVVLLLLFTYRLTLSSTVAAFSLTPFLCLFLAVIFIPPKFLNSPLEEKLIKQIFSFSAWIFLAKISITILGQIDNIMLVNLSGPIATGIYAAANRMTFVFPVVINGLTVVLMPRFAGFNKVEEAKKFLKKVLLTVGLFIIPIMVLYFLSDILVFWLYGPAYAQASGVFRLLLLRTAFFLAATGPLTMLVYFFGESKIFALLSIFQALVLVMANFLFIPIFGASGPAISGAISYGLVFLAATFIIFKKIKEKSQLI